MMIEMKKVSTVINRAVLNRVLSCTDNGSHTDLVLLGLIIANPAAPRKGMAISTINMVVCIKHLLVGIITLI